MREDETTFGIEDLAQICNVPAWLLENPPDWNDRSDPAMKMFHKNLRKNESRAATYVNRINAILKGKRPVGKFEPVYCRKFKRRSREGISISRAIPVIP